VIDSELLPDIASDEGHLLLADFECPHGSLPQDTVIRCDCWKAGPSPTGGTVDQ
jgi:hypothetical protein